jgi:hypothetical protein
LQICPTTITNTAQVSSPTTNPNPANNDVMEDILVIAVAELEILNFEAVDPRAQILVGEGVELTLRKLITNNGPSYSTTLSAWISTLSVSFP